MAQSVIVLALCVVVAPSILSNAGEDNILIFLIFLFFSIFFCWFGFI